MSYLDRKANIIAFFLLTSSVILISAYVVFAPPTTTIELSEDIRKTVYPEEELSDLTVSSDSESFTRSWTYGFKEYKISFDVPKEEYNTYSSKARNVFTYREWGTYYDDPYTSKLSRHIYQQTKDMSREERIVFMTNFARSIDYEEDPKVEYPGMDVKMREYPKFPIETLYNQSGDCEDQAILLAHILDESDYTSYVLTLPSRDGFGHVMVALDKDSINPSKLGNGFSEYENKIIIDPTQRGLDVEVSNIEDREKVFSEVT